MLIFKNKYVNRLKSLLTIVIPTYKRHQLLKRALNFYNNFGVKILVADSTLMPFEDKNKYHCEYYHVPNMYPSKKLHCVISKVITPYILFCTDDDLTIKNSILKCIDYLEKNPFYSAAQGETVFWKHNQNNIHFSPNFHWLYDKDHFDNPNPFERVCEGFEQTLTCFYAVRRTETVKKIASIVEKYEITDLTIYELIHYFIEYLTGYIKILPILYQVRSFEPRQDNSSIGFEKHLVSADGEKFKKLMLEELSQHDNQKNKIDMQSIEKIMNIIYNWLNFSHQNKKAIFHNLNFKRIPFFRPELKTGLSLKGSSRRDWQSVKKFIYKFERN